VSEANRVPATATPLLDVRGLTVEFRAGLGVPPTRAVDEVSFAIGARETVGLVGESGSGKTTIGRAILGLAPVRAGTVAFAGRDIGFLGHRERRRLSSDLQVVFQDPYSSLNPTRTVGQTLAESLRGRDLSRAEVAERVHAMLGRVGLPPDVTSRYPAHFSGGQRQRVAIARALMVHPRLVICDEPVSALDLSVQAQVLNLLRQLQEELDLSYLFIAHNLAVVRYLSHRIIVLYRGRIMEQGPAASVYGDPVHPYTQALLDAAPVPDPEIQRRRRAAADSSVRSEAPPTSAGCPFAFRCPHAIERCRAVRPDLEATDTGSVVACHRWRELRHDGPAAPSTTSRSPARRSGRWQAGDHRP
jgi:oligopeptide/dipeptide ABC transporter ATP-binding protein